MFWGALVLIKIFRILGHVGFFDLFFIYASPPRVHHFEPTFSEGEAASKYVTKMFSM